MDLKKINEPLVNSLIDNERNIYRVKIERIPAKLKMNANQWAVLSEMDGESALTDIAHRLEYTINIVKIAAYFLLEDKVIEKVDVSSANYVDLKIVREIELQLTHILGPVAVIIIDDVLHDLNLTRSVIGKEDVYSYVEAVSNEISDEGKKLKFQQSMLELLAKI